MASIEKGDEVKIADRARAVFERAYGQLPDVAIVTLIEPVKGKKRLHLDRPPHAVWAVHARLVRRKANREKAEAKKAAVSP